MLIRVMIKNLLTGFIAIHDWHIQVKNNEIELFIRFSDQLEGLQPIDSLCHFYLGKFEDLAYLQ
jgi:hypothetical protein